MQTVSKKSIPIKQSSVSSVLLSSQTENNSTRNDLDLSEDTKSPF